MKRILVTVAYAMIVLAIPTGPALATDVGPSRKVPTPQLPPPPRGAQLTLNPNMIGPIASLIPIGGAASFALDMHNF